MAKINRLKSYKPGQSGNPAGRPPGSSLKAQVQSVFIQMMEEQVTHRGKSMAFLTAYKQAFCESATKGGWAAKILAEKLFRDNILENIDESLNRDLARDRDFISYRIFKLCFDIQQTILLSRKRRKLLMAGRRAGKTESLIHCFSNTLTAKDNARALYVGRTARVGIERIFNPVSELIESLGFEIEESSRNLGYFRMANGSEFFVRSNDNKDSRESLRGSHYDLVGIDEVQSQKDLKYLVESIIEPMLEDTRGTLILAGTGPRSAGTYWEDQWLNADESQTLRLNWNLSENPYIPDYATRLAEIRAEKKLDESSSLYQREYLGKPVYDIDALVYRLGEQNYYTDAQLSEWIQSQAAADLYFSAGLDFGYSDSDAIVVILHSRTKRERFLIYEKKQNHLGIAECADAIGQAIKTINGNPLYKAMTNRNYSFFADSGGLGKKIAVDLATHYNLPVVDAYKADKAGAIELLQQEIRQGTIKVRHGSEFDQESVRIVFERDDNDNIIREIDDSTYHPDMADAILYAMRPLWLLSPQRVGQAG